MSNRPSDTKHLSSKVYRPKPPFVKPEPEVSDGGFPPFFLILGLVFLLSISGCVAQVISILG
ncbi:MAG: hypothetical protein IT260_06530 [Saprospiraceae bacterium]|nr:hypothetical protein [Saprospiraceae bacterium]